MSMIVRPVMVVAVTSPTLGSGTPVDRAVGLSSFLGFWKLGWFTMFCASIRSCSLPDSHPGILQLLAKEKSIFDRSGPRSEFLGLVPKEFTERRCIRELVVPLAEGLYPCMRIPYSVRIESRLTIAITSTQ